MAGSDGPCFSVKLPWLTFHGTDGTPFGGADGIVFDAQACEAHGTGGTDGIPFCGTEGVAVCKLSGGICGKVALGDKQKERREGRLELLVWDEEEGGGGYGNGGNSIGQEGPMRGEDQSGLITPAEATALGEKGCEGEGGSECEGWGLRLAPEGLLRVQGMVGEELHENLLEAKYGIMAFRMQQGLDLWNLAAQSANPYELVPSVASPKAINRAYYKMLELIRSFDLVPTPASVPNFRSVHLCEGPGGFIEATLDYRGKLGLGHGTAPGAAGGTAEEGGLERRPIGAGQGGREGSLGRGRGSPPGGKGTAGGGGEVGNKGGTVTWNDERKMAERKAAREKAQEGGLGFKGTGRELGQGEEVDGKVELDGSEGGGNRSGVGLGAEPVQWEAATGQQDSQEQLRSRQDAHGKKRKGRNGPGESPVMSHKRQTTSANQEAEAARQRVHSQGLGTEATAGGSSHQWFAITLREKTEGGDASAVLDGQDAPRMGQGEKTDGAVPAYLAFQERKLLGKWASGLPEGGRVSLEEGSDSWRAASQAGRGDQGAEARNPEPSFNPKPSRNLPDPCGNPNPNPEDSQFVHTFPDERLCIKSGDSSNPGHSPSPSPLLRWCPNPTPGTKPNHPALPEYSHSKNPSANQNPNPSSIHNPDRKCCPTSTPNSKMNPNPNPSQSCIPDLKPTLTPTPNHIPGPSPNPSPNPNPNHNHNPNPNSNINPKPSLAPDINSNPNPSLPRAPHGDPESQVRGQAEGHIQYGADDTGDITKLANITAFTEYVRRRSGAAGIHLVTADGASDASEDFGTQEQQHARLALCQLVAALRVQAPGGSFVLKLFDCFTASTITVLAILSCTYADVRLARLRTTRMCNSERYVVARGFLGRPDWLTEEAAHSRQDQDQDQDQHQDQDQDRDEMNEAEGVPTLRESRGKSSQRMTKLIGTLETLIKAWEALGPEGGKVGPMMLGGFPLTFLESVEKFNAAVVREAIAAIHGALQRGEGWAVELPPERYKKGRRGALQSLRKRVYKDETLWRNAIRLCAWLGVDTRE